jgi:hypothetical protein
MPNILRRNPANSFGARTMTIFMLHSSYSLFSHPSQSQQDHGQGGEEHDDPNGQHHGNQQTHAQGDGAQAALSAVMPTSTTTQKTASFPYCGLHFCYPHYTSGDGQMCYVVVLT